MSSDRLPSWNWKQGTPTQWFSFTSSKIGFVSRSVRKRFRYPSAGIPYTVIVGKDGLVTETFLGAKDADSQYTKLRRALQEAYEAN